MLDGRNNKIFLHENEFNSSEERDSIGMPSNVAAPSELTVPLERSDGSLQLVGIFQVGSWVMLMKTFVRILEWD
jgi:hypothetical protein